MHLKLTFITACLLLSACAPAHRKPSVVQPAAVTVQPKPPERELSIRDFPVTSTKYRILSILLEEWNYFGEQEIIIKSDMESIPRVGVWEDDDASHSDRIRNYWRTAGKYGLSGYDCQQPWSAAFISWVMSVAGIGEDEFPYASAHWVYLARFLDNAGSQTANFVPRSVADYPPKPGDLICASRDVRVDVNPNFLPASSQIENAKLHCDIVTAVKGKTLEAIGGNVRNSVSKSVLQLSPQGYLQPTARRSWFMVVENRMD
ncbi:DUF2272 domain-containing protein [Candidatus Methylospira mobilis]|uniref:DUF2272 domain-containing protein n=1 Tax=Candidatus Methylospira mobilis TaxID=1808979 RepID=A0A5Q0BPD4_9GAMM|nr:DUF2272 domain-containing protein [Candidatus Methylospira mobilis]QFY44054.1 DUF2272 domain-containing protein [Candidatus Methylospira mobilis]WNV05059.1 DUF2272 domain-containing protein [Candidatus Methylospira mobilis]